MRNRETTNSSSAPSASSSWQSYKERGNQHFKDEEYDQALANFQTALGLNCTREGRQILLSNVVACRLKIGGSAMAEVAIDEAKKCIAINDRWSKGHVRLASAYIALGGHSNDACNSLQRALAIDPSNKVARQMLLHELGKARETSRSTPPPEVEPSAPPMEEAYPSSSYFSVDPSAPPMETNPAPNYNNSNSNMPFSTAGFYTTNNPTNSFTGGAGTPPPNDYMGPNNDNNTHNNNQNNDVDDSFTLYERFQFVISRIVSWYKDELNENMRTALKALLVFTIIYVAFGGRFGLTHVFGNNSNENKGNYEYGNAYDRYYSKKDSGVYESTYNNAADERTASTGGYNRYNDNDNRKKYSSSQYRQSADDDYNHHTRSSSRNRSNQFQFPNTLDGSILAMVVLAIFVYGCHRMGLNPLHIIWVLNMMTGNRRQRGYFGGMRRQNMMNGMGMMGMGYQMMNNRRRWNRR